MSQTVIPMPAKAVTAVGFMRRVTQTFRDWNARRLAKAELRSMPNHLLNDIGISRELIDQYVDGAIAKRVATVVELDCSVGEGAQVDRAKAA